MTAKVAPPLPYEPPQMVYTYLGSYVLTAPFEVAVLGRTFVVPAGTRTDLATVPRLFWTVIPPTGAYEAAAVLHDWLVTKGIELGLVTSREADRIFREMMRVAGVGVPLRWCMWAAVRAAAPLSRHRRPSGIVRDLPAVGSIGAVVLAAVYGLAWLVDRSVHNEPGLLAVVLAALVALRSARRRMVA